MSGVTAQHAPMIRPARGMISRPTRQHILDGALVLVLLTVSVQTRMGHTGAPLWEHQVFAAVLALPLLWRRRAPLAVFGVIAAAALVQWFVTGAVVADAALLVAFYTVAANCPPKRTLAAALVLEIGVLLAVLRYADNGANHPFSFVLLSGLVVAAGVLGVNLRVRRAYLAEVEQRAARLEREHDQQARLAAAAERTRIAREMHDIVAHHLSVMIALTDGAALTFDRDPDRAQAAIGEASQTGRAALNELRRVLGVLRDNDADERRAPEPSLADLDDLLDTVRHAGIPVAYQSSGRLDDLPTGLQLSLYRIVQESLTNTVKHAVAASQVTIRIVRHDDTVALTVTDNGASRPANRPPGHGLIGMQERAALHNGRVTAGPGARGWQVHATFPLTSDVLTGS